MPLVVADPDLKQVSEDEDGLGIGGLQMLQEGLCRARRGLAQVQVRKQGDGLPVRWWRQPGGFRHGRRW